MSVLRYMGAALLPLCGWLAGDAYHQQSVTHIRELRESIALLQRVRQEILFRRADLAALYCTLCDEGALSGSVDAHSFQELAPPGSFSGEERQCFTECMKGLGKACAAQEEQRLDYYLARFASFLDQAENLAKAQAELPHKLGFAAGAVLALAFL